jgi:hypothetical protein
VDRTAISFNSFNEFNKAKGGDIWFALDETRPLACFAGIWTNWTSVRKVKEGETTNDSFAFLTTEPNAEVGAIHAKAMSVILTTPDDVETWKTAPQDQTLKLRPLPDGMVRIVARGAKRNPAVAAWCFAQAGGTGGQSTATPIWNPCSVVAAPERMAGPMDSSRSGAMVMMLTGERRPAVRTLRGWAITLLREAGAIRECDEHGWMQDRADPHARERALHMARRDPPPGVSPDAAAAEVRDVLDSIGDTCPECPPQ